MVRHSAALLHSLRAGPSCWSRMLASHGRRHRPLFLLVAAVLGLTGNPAHAISPGVTVYQDLYWVGISIRGTVSKHGMRCGPAVELGLHPVHVRTTWGSPPWLDDPLNSPLNDRAYSLTGWAGLWGNGPTQLGVDLSAHRFRGMYPNRTYVPNVSLVAGWMTTDGHHRAKLGGAIGGGVPLNSTVFDRAGLVFPRGTVGAGVWLGEGVERSDPPLGAYLDGDIAFIAIARAAID